MSTRMVSLCIVFCLTVFPIETGLPSEGPQALPPAEDAKWEAKLNEVIALAEIPGNETIGTFLTNILGVLSGFQFKIDEQLDQKVALRLASKPIREILNLLLLPEGLVWERASKTIKVVADPEGARRRELELKALGQYDPDNELQQILDRPMAEGLRFSGPESLTWVLLRLPYPPESLQFVVFGKLERDVESIAAGKTLRQVLRDLLPARELVWELRGDSILITHGLQRRLFPLTPSEVDKVEEVLGLGSLEESQGDEEIHVVVDGAEHVIQGDIATFEAAVLRVMRGEPADFHPLRFDDEGR